MAWIELHQGLFRHVKTAAVADALRKPRHLIVGHLAELWCWALDARPNGGPLSARDVKLGAEWGGKADAFADALVDAGFLDRDDEGLWLHDWNDYAGRLIDRRRQNADRMKAARALHVSRTNGARASATVPDPTVPNQTEEKNSEKRPLARSKPIDEGFRAEMVERFKECGSPELVNEEIDAALAHTSSRKWTDKRLGVLNWLKRTRWGDERTTGGGAASRESGTHAGAARPGAVARNGYGTSYRARSNLTPPGEFGDTWEPRHGRDAGETAGEGGGGPGVESATGAGGRADPATPRNGVSGV